jgi:hypothetical protein
MRQAFRGDEVDRIVETLLAHPERASELKTLLRNRIENPSVVQFAPVADPLTLPIEDADDMWDNVPV